MVDLYFTVDVVIAIGLLSLGVASLTNRQGYKKTANRIFAAFSVLMALWIISNHISNATSVAQDIVLYANYTVFVSSFCVLLCFMWFVSELVRAESIRRVVKYSLAPLILIAVMGGTPLVVNGIEKQNDIYAIIFGPLVWLYAFGILFMTLVTAYAMRFGLRHSGSAKRRQFITIGVGTLISIPLVIVLSFAVPLITGNFEVTRFGITPLILLVISLYYGVIKYQLFDIRLAAVRTVAYILSLLTLSMTYYGLAYVFSIFLFNGNISFSVSVSPINAFLAIVLAFIFQPIKRFFDKATNKLFYKSNYSTEDFFARLNRTLAVTTDLRDLLERASHEIGQTLKSDQVFFFVYTDNGHHITAGTHQHKTFPRPDADEVGEYYSEHFGVIVASLLENSHPIRRMMISHKIELILPLVKGQKIIGYLCLGDHKNSGYTNRDIKALNTISDELVIAIQNALAVQEIRELNATLQQRIDNATKELRSTNVTLRRLDKIKDEFLSIASHQLRTPLTSVKGYLSMILDGDAGEITNDQRVLLDQAFTSSERMVHLINDFLNVSRLQTGKFSIEKRPTDLTKVVQQEIESLRPSAESRSMHYMLHLAKDIPTLELDEDKIRQVIMNFADNALYYSHENSKIDISLSSQNGDVIFTVKDNGIGVPVDEQEQLFTKFFRASNAKKQRPDGTGVGLFLAKKVINGHNGKIIFESKEGKGSTFGFKVPIK